MEAGTKDDVRFDEEPTEGGTLGGYNTTPADPIEVDDEFGAGDGETPSPIDPGAEGGDDEQDDEGDEAKAEPAPEPAPEPDPPAAVKKKTNGRSKPKTPKKNEAKGGAPIRTYIVFEEFALDPEGKGYQEVHRVEARNAENAIRKAYKELAGDKDEASATLVVVPESMWRPTPVHLKPKTTVSVSIG